MNYLYYKIYLGEKKIVIFCRGICIKMYLVGLFRIILNYVLFMYLIDLICSLCVFLNFNYVLYFYVIGKRIIG